MSQRALPTDDEGRLFNEKTGKWVKADGRVGKSIAAQWRANLQEFEGVLPRGFIGKDKAKPAEPGAIELSKQVKIVEPSGRVVTGAFVQQRYRPTDRARTVAAFAKAIIATQNTIPEASRRQIIIEFEDPLTGDRIFRTIHAKTVKEAMSKIDLIQGVGEAIHGSDIINTNYQLDPTTFELGYVQRPAGGGLKFTGISQGKGRIHPHFKLKDFSTKTTNKGDCLLAILRAVTSALAKKAGLPAPRWPQNGTIRSRLKLPDAPAPIPADNETIGKLAELFGLRIRIVTGMGVPEPRVYDDNAERQRDRNRCITVAQPIVIAEGGSDTASLCDIYLADEHYEYIAEYLRVDTCPITGDIITNPPRTMLEIFHRVRDQGRNWHARTEADVKIDSEINEALEAKKGVEYKEHVIVFDYETTYDHITGTIEPYALGYIAFNPENHKDGDFTMEAEKVSQIIRKPGDNNNSVTAPLIDLLCAAPPDVRYTLVSFNGARFDHYLLARAANNRGLLHSVFATAQGGIRSLMIGRHCTLDLAKLCPGTSLKGACKGFKTAPEKMDGFSHHLPQEARSRGKLFEWIKENCALLSEYLYRDILSTASLFIKLTTTLTELTGAPCIGSRAVGTIGGHAWEKMNQCCELPAAVKDESLDKLIRTGVTGGRVQSYVDKVPHKKIILEEAGMVDFASLYPTVMNAVPAAAELFNPEDRWGHYPTAPGLLQLKAQLRAVPVKSKEHKAIAAQIKTLRETCAEPTVVQDYIPGQVGLFDCTIHAQPPNLPNVIPRRVEGEPLDWDYRGPIRAQITHTEISLIRRYGGVVEVHSGLVWPVHTQGAFSPYVQSLAAIKDEQDSMAKDDPKANPALRSVVKLLLNSASGKCCQANYDDTVVLAKGSGAQLAAEAKMRQDCPRTWIPLGGETCLIVGKKAEDKVYTARAKPSILAVFIYSYSRALVWRTLCQHNCLYSDTDSGLFTKQDYEALRKAFPGLDPTGRKKRLGDLEQELKPHKYAWVYRMAPKDYGIFLTDEKCNLLPDDCHKIRMKGVHQGADRLVAADARDALEHMTLEERAREYNEESNLKSKPLAKTEVALEMFERRANGEKVTVLCSQIERGTFSQDSPFDLTQRFLLKQL